MGSCLDNIRKITNDSLIHRRSLKMIQFGITGKSALGLFMMHVETVFFHKPQEMSL